MLAPEIDHRAARTICNSIKSEPIYLHEGNTTDLILGGGCPRCNMVLQALKEARDDERKAILAALLAKIDELILDQPWDDEGAQGAEALQTLKDWLLP